MTRSWWGWGDEEDAVAGDELDGLAQLVACPVRRRAARAARPAGRGRGRPARAPRAAARRPVPPRGRGRGPAPVAGAPRPRPGVPRRGPGRPRHAWSPPRTWWRTPARPPRSRRCWTGPRTPTSPSCPSGAGPRSSAGVTPPDGPTVTLDLTRMDRVVEVDAMSLAAHVEAGALGPRIEDQLRPARADVAALPPVVGVLHARRVDRDPGRRALRHPLDPHRRPGRVGRRRDADGALGQPAAAGLGRGAVTGPAAARVGGHAGRHHRRVGPGPAAADVPGPGVGDLPGPDRRGTSGPGAGPVRARPRQLPAAGPHRGRPGRGRRRDHDRAGARASSRPTTPCTPGWTAPSSWWPTTAGHVPTGRATAKGTAPATAPARAGAWRRTFLRAPVPARRAGATGRGGRDLRDRHHLGPLRRVRRPRAAGRDRRGHRGLRGRAGVAAVDPRLPRRGGAVPDRDRPDARATTRSPRGTRSRPRPSEAILAAGGTITHHHAVGRDHAPWYRAPGPGPVPGGHGRGPPGRGPRRDLQPRRAREPPNAG